MNKQIAKIIETELELSNVSVIETFKADNGNQLSLVYFEIDFYGIVEKHNSIFETTENEVVGQNSLLFQNNIKAMEDFDNDEIIELYKAIKGREDLSKYQDR